MPTQAEPAASICLEYDLVRSRRRTLSLIIRPDGTLEVRSPLRYPKRDIDRFVSSKTPWIERKRAERGDGVKLDTVPSSLKNQADDMLRRRLDLIQRENSLIAPRSIQIRDQRSRWGSCSSRGTISINRRCALLPVHLLDYVLLHELCHLKHMNHSAEFWKMVEQYMPDARQRRRELRKFHIVTDKEKTS